MSAEENSGVTNPAAEEPSILGQLMEEADKAATTSQTETPPDELDLIKRQLAFEKQRNDSLQGRIDSQLRPMNDLVKQLRDQVDELRGKSVDAPVSVPELTREEILAELTPEERAKIGEKQLDVLTRLIERPLKTMATKLEKKLLPRVQAAESLIAARAGNDLWAAVDKLSPGAKADNDRESPEWVDFLSSVDPISGKTFRELGNSAVDAGDVGRLAQLHDQFAKGRRPETVNDLDGQLRPNGSRAEPTRVSGGDKPKIKSSEVDKFYADLSRGKYKDKPELAEKMDALISEAVTEGRIIP